MKYLVFLLVLIGNQQLIQAQGQACCQISANDEFVRMSSSFGFQEKHDIPGNLVIDSTKGNTITYKNTDGKTSNAWLIKSTKKSNQYIFVIHEWWGLNNFVKNEAIKLSQSFPNANVLCLDLYDGKLATTRDSAAKFMGQVKEARAKTIINGAIKYAGKKASIVTTGWCFGGGWSLQASLLAGKQAKACVIYYGMPEKNTDVLKNLNAEVVMIHPNKDLWINKEVVDAFEKNMKDLNKPLNVYHYEADHAFANPSNTKNYIKEMADDAYEKMRALFAKYIK
jgi:carboxymethylenebutenolidase